MGRFESIGQNNNTKPESRDEVFQDQPELLKTRESASELITALDSVEGFMRARDQNALLKLPSEHLIVRREDPDRILELISKHEPILVSFVGGSPYANSVEWDPKNDGPRGLENAYLEGYSHKNNVVAVYGFERPEDFYFEKLDDSQRVFSGVDRTRVRAASGFVPLESIEFVSLRIPVSAMRESDLTEEELDKLYDYNSQNSGNRKPTFVYRTYIRTMH